MLLSPFRIENIFRNLNKDALSRLNNSLTKNPGNPRQEYMDQMKRKQRYTALDHAAIDPKRIKMSQKSIHSGNSNSFTGTYPAR
mmetsp:Transcript_20482/g.20219  ORF Transcript_20482/g.20219 Transcript_20482/m.20219 type:complete len:84 (-) Transcript_20482:32-283(-)